MMNHQKLHCYQRSLRLAEALSKAMPEWPGGTARLKDQLRRASISAVLNIAEGAGKASPRDQAHFYVIARGSMQEVSAAIDIARALGFVSDLRHQELEQEITVIVKMTSKLIAATTYR